MSSPLNELLDWSNNEKVEILNNLLLLETPNSLFVSNILWDVIKDENILNKNNLEVKIKNAIHQLEKNQNG